MWHSIEAGGQFHWPSVTLLENGLSARRNDGHFAAFDKRDVDGATHSKWPHRCRLATAVARKSVTDGVKFKTEY
jgi:hypothetical protein